MIDLKQKGMTLIETLVTLGIFSTVVVFTMGLFISANKSQIAANEMNLVNSEASFLLERIGREVRMATENDNIIVESSGALKNKKIAFTNNESFPTIYCMAINSSDCNGTGPAENIAVSYDSGTTYTLINSSDVTVDSLNFYINGNILANEQPIITILLEVASVKIPTISTRLQTSIVPRVY